VVYGELITKEKLKQSAPDFLESLEKYEDILDSHKRLTFNRMIHLAIDNLAARPEVLGHVNYLIVDEYQDINRAQERLIRLIGNNARIFIVGDPRQTIYQWRGSDERCFEDFADYYSDTETVSISENRRSVRAVLNIANRFADNFEKRYEHLDPTRNGDGGVYLGEFETAEEEAGWIADQIESHVGNGACSYSDIGILFRSVKTSAPVFIDVFRERDIPVMVGGKVGLFRRFDVKAVSKLFAWLYDDGFWREDQWSHAIEGEDLLYSALGDWGAGMSELPLPDDIVATLTKWKDSTLNSKFKNFTEAYYELLTLLKYHELDPDNANHAVIMANLGRFSSLLTDYETANMLGGRKVNWKRDLKGLCWFMSTYATGSYEEQTGDDIRGVDAVHLMTVHQAKGLEWPIVFIPAMTNKRFPSSMMGRTGKWLIPRDIFDVDKYEGDIESERKLFYVALTRAKDELVVSRFRRITQNVGPSEFISEGLDLSKMTALSDRDSLPLHVVAETVDTEDIQTYAAGEIITYRKCPYFYRFRHVWGYQPGLNVMLGYGITLHFCLRYAAELIRDDGYSPMSAIATSVDRNFHLPFAGEARMKKAKEKAKRKLVQFVMEHVDDMHNIKEVESRIEFPVCRATIAGKVDVILHDGEGVEVRDYKTSDTVTTPEEAAMQVQLYTTGLRMIGEPVTRGSISYLEDAATEPVDVGDDALHIARTTAEKNIEGIVNRDFTPRPGKPCKICDYTRICRYRG
jgi:DNA helicase-2/ATP-dependent DNA helicase PcrA